jgi:hypothetical protein
MPDNLLPSRAAGEDTLEYVRRAVDHGLRFSLGPDAGLLGVYCQLSNLERPIFVSELIYRYIHLLGPTKLLDIERGLDVRDQGAGGRFNA